MFIWLSRSCFFKNHSNLGFGYKLSHGLQKLSVSTIFTYYLNFINKNVHNHRNIGLITFLCFCSSNGLFMQNVRGWYENMIVMKVSTRAYVIKIRYKTIKNVLILIPNSPPCLGRACPHAYWKKKKIGIFLIQRMVSNAWIKIYKLLLMPFFFIATYYFGFLINIFSFKLLIFCWSTLLNFLSLELLWYPWYILLSILWFCSLRT